MVFWIREVAVEMEKRVVRSIYFKGELTGQLMAVDGQMTELGVNVREKEEISWV